MPHHTARHYGMIKNNNLISNIFIKNHYSKEPFLCVQNTLFLSGKTLDPYTSS